jgi:hypothetical protein
VPHPSSRWVAAIPFGAGQFQNGQTALGWIFLGVESALAIGTSIAISLKLVFLKNQLDATAESDQYRANQWLQRGQQAWIAELWLAGGFAAAAVAGIVHAQLTFVQPYTEVRHRPLPKLALTPIVAPQPNGAFLGLQARF